MQNGANSKKTCFTVRITENEIVPSGWEAGPPGVNVRVDFRAQLRGCGPIPVLAVK